jgi:hypothetical protein
MRVSPVLGDVIPLEVPASSSFAPMASANSLLINIGKDVALLRALQ